LHIRQWAQSPPPSVPSVCTAGENCTAIGVLLQNVFGHQDAAEPNAFAGPAFTENSPEIGSHVRHS
jgi:hypothetical protein